MSLTALVIGGSSSLFPSLLEEATRRNFSVSATLRPNSTQQLEAVAWNTLDLSEFSSISDFLASIQGLEFDVIFFLAGAKSPTPEESWPSYIETHLTHSLALVKQLTDKLKSRGTLIYLSSRAAIYPSRDFLYSAVKAGMSSGLKSLTLQLRPGQKIFSVAPGLIKESGMYFDMPEEIREEHHRRANGELLDLRSFAEELFRVMENRDRYENGEIVELGTRYS